MPKPERDDNLLVIGRIGAPKGVRGDLKIHSYSGEFGHFMDLKTVLLEGELPAAAAVPAPGAASAVPKPAAASPVPHKRRLNLKVLRVQASEGGLSMAFEGYESPETARKLTGMDILATRDQAAPLAENEWYVTDLVGLVLVSEGKRLATVEAVLEGGPDPWLEVVPIEDEPESRGSGPDRSAKRSAAGASLVPFRKEFVGEVDLEKGEIELLAPWLLEE